MIQVVDLGLNNLASLRTALGSLVAGEVEIVSEASEMNQGGLLVIPGTGAFGEAMLRLNSAGLSDAIVERSAAGSGFTLGICLGMHLLGQKSEESPAETGLGIVEGSTLRLVPATNLSDRVPRVGWEQVDRGLEGDFPDFSIENGHDFYFSHSYHLVLKEGFPAETLTSPFASGDVLAGFRAGSIAGFQFHPEKSSRNGLVLLRDFLKWSHEI